MIDFLNMKKEDFEDLPFEDVDFRDTNTIFHSLILIPTEEIHDSEWGCIKVVGIKDNGEMTILTNWSDVIEIEGIGGYGLNWRENTPKRMVEARGWAIDLLPCGYFRLWNRAKCVIGSQMSSFEVFSHVKE